MVVSSQWQVRNYPHGPVSADNFQLVEVSLPALNAGEVLVRNTWTSVDPSLCLRLRENAPAGYFSAFPLHRAMDGIMTIGVVEKSRAAGFAVGDTVSHAMGWRSHCVVEAGRTQLSGLGTLTKVDVVDVPPEWYLGPLGGIGLTAYSGLSLVGALESGQTVWVSAAAGAVGSIAAQLAQLHGNRVIGSAGSDDKVNWLRNDLGLDAAFNYRAEDPTEALARLAPDGIDVYFDGVGGSHLEAALESLRRGGRVAMCGSVSDYTSSPTGPRNLFLAVAKDIGLRGFRGSSNLHLLPEAQKVIGHHLREGRISHRQTVFEGIASAPAALGSLMEGATVGKTLVKI